MVDHVLHVAREKHFIMAGLQSQWRPPSSLLHDAKKRKSTIAVVRLSRRTPAVRLHGQLWRSPAKGLGGALPVRSKPSWHARRRSPGACVPSFPVLRPTRGRRGVSASRSGGDGEGESGGEGSCAGTLPYMQYDYKYFEGDFGEQQWTPHLRLVHTLCLYFFSS